MKRFALSLALASGAIVGADGARQAGGSAPGAAPTLSPGLVISVSIYGGHDSNGNPLGDYENTISITDVSSKGIGFHWSMTYPLNRSGTRFVREEDIRTGHKAGFYYGSEGVLPGYTDWIRIPDPVFTDLKAGRKTAFDFDGPDRLVSLEKIGEENLALRINEQPTTVHTLKVRTANNWTMWVLDNPQFPILIKGDGANVSHWVVPSLSYSTAHAKNLLNDLKRSGTATSHAILFAFNSAELKAESKPILTALAEYLASTPAVKLSIEGHTDNVGGAPFNLDLSKRRAASVKQFLVDAHVAADRLTTAGLGLTQPVGDNATPEGRAANRRVIFRELTR